MLKPRLSIVIPFHDDSVKKTLDSLSRCDYVDQCEIILVADGTVTLNLIEPYANKPKLLFREKTGKIGYLRNCGVAAATASRIYFVDSDCTVQPDVIKLILSHEDYPVVKGKNVFYGSNFLSKLDAAIRDERYSRSIDFAYCPNLAIDKKVFNLLGRFNEERTYGSDGEFAKQIQLAGIKVYYNPFCIVHHDVTNRTLRIFQKWQLLGEARFYRYRNEPVTNWLTTYFPDSFNRSRGILFNVGIALCNCCRAIGIIRAFGREFRRKKASNVISR